MKDSKKDTNRKSSSLFEIFEKADNFLSAFFADFGKCGVESAKQTSEHVLRRNLIRVNFLHSKNERVEKFRAANNPRHLSQDLYQRDV